MRPAEWTNQSPAAVTTATQPSTAAVAAPAATMAAPAAKTEDLRTTTLQDDASHTATASVKSAIVTAIVDQGSGLTTCASVIDGSADVRAEAALIPTVGADESDMVFAELMEVSEHVGSHRRGGEAAGCGNRSKPGPE